MTLDFVLSQRLRIVSEVPAAKLRLREGPSGHFGYNSFELNRGDCLGYGD